MQSQIDYMCDTVRNLVIFLLIKDFEAICRCGM